MNRVKTKKTINEMTVFLRKRGDSNPRYSYPYVSLANWWFQPLTHTSLNLHCFSNAVQMYGKLLDYANLSIIFFSDFFQ